MGSHNWVEQCPYCGFEKMAVSSCDGVYFEVNCQICGYAIWTEGRVPDDHDVELAKRVLREITDDEKQKAIELHEDDNIPLVARLRGRTQTKS